jgi:chemotaxis protein MotB
MCGHLSQKRKKPAKAAALSPLQLRQGATMSEAKRPIIVIKKKGGHGGHHGGAWKVAYADFVTAMMALFIVLWLLNSSVKLKKAVAGYFNDPKSSSKETGSDKIGDDDSIPIDKKNVEKLKEQIQKAIKDQKDLEKLAKQIEITITPEGLRIELIEDKKGTFFESGSARLSQTGQELLGMLAQQLKTLPNHLLLEGHTDAQPYSSDNGYTNWELSADRANAARRVLQQDGVGTGQISQVRGFADQLLRVKNDPLDPTNRRISLIVQWVQSTGPPEDAKAESGKGEGKGEEGKTASKSESKSSESAKLDQPEKPASSEATVTKPSTRVNPTATTKPAAGAVAAKPGLMDRLKSMLPGSKAKK